MLGFGGGGVRRKALGKAQRNFKKLGSQIELGDLFSNEFTKLGVKSSSGLDGCARWRRPAQGPCQGATELKKLGSKIELGSDLQRNLRSWGVQ